MPVDPTAFGQKPPRRARFLYEPLRPYSLALTAQRFARLPEIVDRFEKGVYRRLVPVGSGTVLVSVRQVGPPGRAALEVGIAGRDARSPQARNAALDLIRRTLGTDSDVRPFYRALKNDPWLSEPIRRFRGLRVAGAASLWEALATAILSQQIRLSFAYSIRSELARALGRLVSFDGETFVTFPTPEAIAREGRDKLRRFRISAAKATALAALARSFLNGELREEDFSDLDEERAIERLTALPGIGRWTAEIALLRGLGRMDVFPAADLGVVRYVAQGLLGRRRPAREPEMRRFAEKWRPHRGLALAYAYAELARRKEIQKSQGRAAT